MNKRWLGLWVNSPHSLISMQHWFASTFFALSNFKIFHCVSRVIYISMRINCLFVLNQKCPLLCADCVYVFYSLVYLRCEILCQLKCLIVVIYQFQYRTESIANEEFVWNMIWRPQNPMQCQSQSQIDHKTATFFSMRIICNLFFPCDELTQQLFWVTIHN